MMSGLLRPNCGALTHGGVVVDWIAYPLHYVQSSECTSKIYRAQYNLSDIRVVDSHRLEDCGTIVEEIVCSG